MPCPDAVIRDRSGTFNNLQPTHLRLSCTTLSLRDETQRDGTGSACQSEAQARAGGQGPRRGCPTWQQWRWAVMVAVGASGRRPCPLTPPLSVLTRPRPLPLPSTSHCGQQHLHLRASCRG